MGQFVGDSKASSFEIHKDLSIQTLDPNMLNALIAAWQANGIPSSDLWGQLRKYEIIANDKTDEEIQGEIDLNPTGLGLDGE
jgi:hypothetical protein